jgi:hypothetical protein
LLGLPGVQPVAFGPHALPLPLHDPPWHVSVAVHELLSLHEVPSAFGVRPQLPLLGLQLPSLQALPAQLLAVPARHTPPEHASFCVQGSPSSQGKALFWFRQPRVASQLSVVQGLPSSQLGALPPLHPPALQVSPTVHALLSSHAWPWLIGVATQPWVGLQVPALHWLLKPEQSSLGTASQVPA